MCREGSGPCSGLMRKQSRVGPGGGQLNGLVLYGFQPTIDFVKVRGANSGGRVF
jgi:hypothetical protein